MAPTGSPTWPIDLINGDPFLFGSSSYAAVAGYPNICVPAGFSFGLPVGISIFGRAWSEPTLIKIASGFENVTQVRQPPQFLPTLELERRPKNAGSTARSSGDLASRISDLRAAAREILRRRPRLL